METAHRVPLKRNLPPPLLIVVKQPSPRYNSVVIIYLGNAFSILTGFRWKNYLLAWTMSNPQVRAHEMWTNIVSTKHVLKFAQHYLIIFELQLSLY